MSSMLMLMDKTFADNRPYLCELGVQAGCGYYVGDATPHIFQDVRETYGAHFRYKFDQRWALQVKGLAHTIKGKRPAVENTEQQLYWTGKMVNADVMVEFNFFRFGNRQYDARIKPYSPYIFLGLGASLYGKNMNKIACYIPVGIGFKWKFSKHMGLNIAWQHNIYLADNLENIDEFGNTYNMNGANIMNCDITSQLTLGIVFEFAKKKKVCKFCQ